MKIIVVNNLKLKLRVRMLLIVITPTTIVNNAARMKKEIFSEKYWGRITFITETKGMKEKKKNIISIEILINKIKTPN